MKKGFTLIELLAVIVILAIIATIATPIVLGIINDTKKSATVQSARFYLDAAINAIMKENMNANGNLNPEQCVINSDGSMNCDEYATALEVEVEGQKPTSGTITLNQGDIVDATLVFDDGTVSMNTDNELVYQD